MGPGLVPQATGTETFLGLSSRSVNKNNSISYSGSLQRLFLGAKKVTYEMVGCKVLN